jgi:hypothetical protein
MIPLVFDGIYPVDRTYITRQKPVTVQTDYLNVKRSIVETCRERGWEVHPRSKELVRSVGWETIPDAVVSTPDGLMAVWVAGRRFLKVWSWGQYEQG